MPSPHDDFEVAFCDLVLDRLQVGYNLAISDEGVYRMRREFDAERRRHVQAVLAKEEEPAPLDTLLARSMAFQTYVDPMLAQMVMGLRADLLAEKVAEKKMTFQLEDTVVFSFPTTWYEHLRQTINRWAYGHDWVPRPVARLLFKQVKLTHHERTASQTKRVVLEQFATFPASPLRTPERDRGPISVRLERTRVS